jgi:hypothetical protein
VRLVARHASTAYEHGSGVTQGQRGHGGGCPETERVSCAAVACWMTGRLAVAVRTWNAPLLRLMWSAPHREGHHEAWSDLQSTAY